MELVPGNPFSLTNPLTMNGTSAREKYPVVLQLSFSSMKRNWQVLPRCPASKYRSFAILFFSSAMAGDKRRGIIMKNPNPNSFQFSFIQTEVRYLRLCFFSVAPSKPSTKVSLKLSSTIWKGHPQSVPLPNYPSDCYHSSSLPKPTSIHHVVPYQKTWSHAEHDKGYGSKP